MIIERELRTRKDLVLLLLDWLRPLKTCYSPGAARLLPGDTAAHYSRNAAGMEGYARVLWGLGPLFAQEASGLPPETQAEIAEWKALVLRGLINGTDPRHEEYWLDVGDYDQKMVEMAAIVNALLLAPGVLWDPMTARQRENVVRWLAQINGHEVHGNNWRFFRILVNMFFKRKGLACDEGRLAEDWQVIENCYEGGGWYYDGHPGQKDYYIPFAMHYYGLLYSVSMEEQEPGRCRELRSRGRLFSEDFLYWFDKDGREVPFGRSLTYRFAHSAFFSALVYAGGSDRLPVLKHMILGNLRYWSSMPIFDNGGILTIGYQYPNMIMSEHYNAPGSPYWGLKTFLVLALPEDHAFWQCGEEEPVYEGHRFLEKAGMLSIHEKSGHVLLYPAGQHSFNFGNTIAKYQKFVYSNLFGFSVPRGEQLEDGAFDNVLAVRRKGEKGWHMKDGDRKCRVTEHYVSLDYEPVKGLEIKTVIVPLRLGHVRLHYIHTTVEAELADGGFAIKKEDKADMAPDMISVTPKEVSCECPWGNAGAVCLAGEGDPRLITAFPNTNIMYGSTVIPTLIYKLQPGDHFLAGYFFGDGASERVSREVPGLRMAERGTMVKIVYGPEEILIEEAP